MSCHDAGVAGVALDEPGGEHREHGGDQHRDERTYIGLVHRASSGSGAGILPGCWRWPKGG